VPSDISAPKGPFCGDLEVLVIERLSHQASFAVRKTVGVMKFPKIVGRMLAPDAS